MLFTADGKIEKLKLRVLTYNIHNGIDWRGNYRLKRILEFIGDVEPDLAGLQEVSRFWGLKTHNQDMAQIIAEELKMFVFFGPALSKGKKAFGNLILSKHPIVNGWIGILPGGSEPRNFTGIQALIRGFRINFLTTHLGLDTEERLSQAARIGKFGRGLGKPLIITGDFNEPAGGPGVALLKKNWIKLGRQPERGTLRLRRGEIGPEIDLIFTTPDFTLKRLSVVDNYLSDHLPVIADLELDRQWSRSSGNQIYY